VTSFELFVATRYLRAQRKQVMISVITGISIVGVAAGVMALVIALAINNGFRSSLEGSLLGATAHVSILEKETAVGIDDWQQIAQKLSKIPHVTSASPGLYDSGYINGPVTGSGAVIKGVSIGPNATVPDTLRHLKAGSMNGLNSKDGELPGIILGSRLSDSIGAVVGKTVQLLVPNGELAGPLGVRPRFVRLRVAGTFESGFYDLDMNWAFMALPQVQKAFVLDDVVNSIELRLDDIYKSDEVAAAAEAIIGPKLTASTWQEQNRPVLNALKTERMVTAVTIGLIQVVAALNILIALVMMVMEKHRDIAILLSMGTKVRQIRKIFILEGALIGAVGTSLGLIVGYTVCFLADNYRWLKLDEQVYSLAYVPFSPRWTDGVWIAAAAIAVSLLATLYPAHSATRIAPVEALRYE
jgi:lipoprotein-releasing system permease protein